MRCNSESYEHQETQSHYVAEVADPYGTTMFYQGTLKGCVEWRDFKLTLDPSSYENGLTNTATGELSGRTNLKNSTVVINCLDGNHICVTSGDGTKRYYRFLKIDYSHTTGSQERQHYDRFIDEQKQYVLSFEVRPNGRVIHYHITSDGKLSSIRAANASGSKVFSSVSFHYNLYKDDPAFNKWNCHFQALTSTGQTIVYTAKCVKEDGRALLSP